MTAATMGRTSKKMYLSFDLIMNPWSSGYLTVFEVSSLSSCSQLWSWIGFRTRPWLRTRSGCWSRAHRRYLIANHHYRPATILVDWYSSGPLFLDTVSLRRQARACVLLLAGSRP